MVTILYPKKKGERITYHLDEHLPVFTSVEPPDADNVGVKGSRAFFLEYRKNVLSKYMPPMYKWGKSYESYNSHPRLLLSQRKQRWEEMFSRPNMRYTLKDEVKLKEIDDFYMLCQFQRQYYQDYTGHLHPLNYFQMDEYKWAPPPHFNSTYLQFPSMYLKYRQPVTLPITTKRAWIEPFEPCRRLAGKHDPYPNFKFSR